MDPYFGAVAITAMVAGVIALAIVYRARIKGRYDGGLVEVEANDERTV